MHELALADAVIASALEAAEREKLRVITKIAVRVGELQRIETELFRFALERVMPEDEPRLAATAFELTLEPARFLCRVCGRRFAHADAGALDERQAEAVHFVPELAHAFMRCPGCRSADFEVVAGRGVSIEYVEGD